MSTEKKNTPLKIRKIDAKGKPVILVGDVHGCFDEYNKLLATAQSRYGKDAILISLGDIVDRGPGVHDALRMSEEEGVLMVMGNHEEKLIRYKAGRDVKIRKSQQVSIDCMTEEDYKYIATSDHYIEIPEYNLKAVHGGFFPDSATETQPMKCIIRLRYIIPGTHQIFRPGEQPEKAVFWGDVFPGPEHAIFGHDHAVEIREFDYATGIDTG